METELELASVLKNRGDDVTIIRCRGELKSCLVNPYHNRFICASCQSKYDFALELSDLKDVRIISLPLVDTQYDFLPEAFQSVADLKKFKFQGFDAGTAVASTLIGRLDKDHKFDTVRHKSKVRRELETYVDLVRSLEKVFSELRPDEVYFFNGRFSLYHPLKTICIRDSITFYTHERAGVLNKYILRKNTMPHSIEYSTSEINALWDSGGSDRENVGARFFTDRRNNVIQSWLSFTESQKKGLLPPGFDRTKTNVVIFNSTMEEYEGMEEWKNPLYEDDNQGLERILESFKADASFQFYLRVHPNLKLLANTQLSEIKTLAARYKQLYVIKPEDTYDSYALMEYADKVITFGSTIGCEATFWGKPSILLGKSMYMNIDACYEPTSHKEAVELIRKPILPPKDRVNALKYGYWELQKGQPFTYFEQTDLFKMRRNGRLIAPRRVFRLLEALPKLLLIRNRRGLNHLANKLKHLFRWK